MALDRKASGHARWYHGWTVVAAIWVASVTTLGIPFSAMTLFLHDWSRDLKSPISQILLAQLPMSMMIALLAPIIGMLADKRPARLIFAVGLAVTACFMILMSYVTTTWQFWFLYAALPALGIACASSVPGNALISRWFVNRLGLALGIVGGSFGASGMLVPLIVSAIMPHVGWRSLWFGAGIVTALVILPLVVIALRNAPDERDDPSYLVAVGEEDRAQGDIPRAAARDLRLRDILHSRSFWLLILSYLPITALSSSVQLNLAPIVTRYGFEPESAGPLLSLFSAVGTVGTLIMGMASDRLGHWRMIALLALMVAAGAVILSYDGSAPLAVVGIVLTGMGPAIWALLATAAAMEFGPHNVGRVYGAFTLFGPLASAAAVTFARLEELAGSYSPPLLGYAAAALLGGACVLLSRRQQGQVRLAV